MVFHLPDEDSLRQRVNYTEEFALTLLWNVGIVGMIVTGLFLVFFIFKQYQLRVASNEAMRESILTQEDRSSTAQLSARRDSEEGEALREVRVVPKTKLFKVINLMTSIFFYLFWITASLVYLVFFMFGYFGRGTHIDVLSVFLLNAALILPTLLWKNKTKNASWGKLKGEAIFTMVMLILWLGLSVFIVVATKGACVCYFNDQYGFTVAKDARFSTEFTRIGNIGVPCMEDEVCRLYATVPEDASTAVFFNAHAGLKVPNLVFTLKLNNVVIASKNITSPVRMDNVESIGQRNVYSTLFSGLNPDTTYQLQVSDINGKLLAWANYKTVPGIDGRQVKMAVGGDLGMTKQGKQMTSYLAAFNPDIIILGGDTVYDDGMRACYNSWDQFYLMFSQLNKKLNRIVPIIMTVGNHDVGFDAMSDNAISTSLQELPLFFLYNPQHVSDKNDVPSIDSRKSYHYHKIGPTLHLSLDSGYIKSHSSQVTFIRSTAESNPSLYLFANYHNPIYPACTNSNPGSNDRLVVEAGQQYWTPLFDKFNFVASMEHHTHYRKFTYPIKNSTVDMSGTRYIGDGSWGVTEDICPIEKHTPHPEMMEKVAYEEANHLWQITLQLTDAAKKTYSINYTALDLNGFVVTQKVDTLRSLA